MTSTTTNIPHDHQLQQERAPVAMMKPQAKKQARRRTHASRPYQERLLNMAEARREIVTALKIHRANMRHQQPCTSSYQHQADTLQLLRQPPPPLQQQQQVQVVFQDDQSQQASVPPAPTSYASFANHQLRNPLAHWVAAAAAHAGCCYSPPPVLPCDLTQLEEPMPTTSMGGYGLEQLAQGLPAQPLGLNLSFQGFVDGAKDCEGLYGVPAVIQSASPVAASSYSAYSPPATEMASGGAHESPALSSTTAEKHSSPAEAPAAAALIAPPVLDDGEREAQSAGETMQGVECWGEATTAADVAAASAWWSKILLESVESAGGDVAEGGGAVGYGAEDVAAAAVLPAEWRWLCDDGVGEQGAAAGADKPADVVLETKLADGGQYDYTCCYNEEGGRRSDGGGDGIALPCMDDDIEGWEAEWFSCSS